MKRFFDIVFSAFLLALLSPLIALLLPAVAISTQANPLFVQARAGRNGRKINIYKLRSMTEARDSAGAYLPDANRLTAVGGWIRRYSLDELPQLFNVIRGDLSLIGPRALPLSYVPLYNDHQKKRLLVKPGISGWAQVNGRNLLSWEEKFELDVWYVENQSAWLDIKIFFKTIAAVLSGKGLSAEGHATAAPFRGSLCKT